MTQNSTTPKPGHNSAAAKDQLRAIVERVERLEEEKRSTSDDIRDVYAEAKGSGFDVKALRAIVRLRRQDANERVEQQAIIDTYMHALGMLADTPLGEAAIARDLAPKPHTDVSNRPFVDDLDIPPELRR